jgi:uncharacterized protein (TIGR00730 family)
MTAQTIFLKHANKLDPASKFRVSVLGSARTKPEEMIYQETYDFCERLAQKHIGVVTGGGPGIMEAANHGHNAGNESSMSESVGLTIELPFESEGNDFLDRQQHFQKFSNRLDQFMKLSNVAVIMPGGIGTCLELFYTWQLIQVGHICHIPVILYGEMWKPLLEWVKTDLLAKGKISEKDLDLVCYAPDIATVEKIIDESYETFKQAGNEACINLKKYQ